MQQVQPVREAIVHLIQTAVIRAVESAVKFVAQVLLVPIVAMHVEEDRINAAVQVHQAVRGIAAMHAEETPINVAATLHLIQVPAIAISAVDCVENK